LHPDSSFRTVRTTLWARVAKVHTPGVQFALPLVPVLFMDALLVALSGAWDQEGASWDAVNIELEVCSAAGSAFIGAAKIPHPCGRICLLSLFVNGEGVISLTCGLVPRPALSAPAVEHSATFVAVRSFKGQMKVLAAELSVLVMVERIDVMINCYMDVAAAFENVWCEDDYKRPES
jgi:hypothetical protein